MKMSYKKFAASLLFALLSSAYLFPNLGSAGEPELYFYPKNKWVVSHANSGQKDPAVFEALNGEMKRQEDGLEMIASEKMPCRCVIAA